ncbi:MAG: toll/interleukin-1 receptor domain-containing protein, partial [Lachnospiraceae bacterium]|nr:toll/interleukin-1 receptor domain-containing protein [Lachnospiraceae bacterium]
MALAEKYNAFISYRHSEIDNKIASEIQTQLERFKIPKQIQKKTGIKRFDRIFRDKEELPTTSDLKHDIENALKVSDFLIVICSERTHESLWVQREIETFLKYHSKEEVFTVLVDGEPGDVIPDILLHQTVTRQLSDGTYATFEELAEPLSCDYRMPVRKARKEELPRLVCSMLHCTYDELMM